MKRFTIDFQNKPSDTARRESCWSGTCHLPSWGWSVSLERLPAWHRAMGREQGGTVPWEASGSPIHALGVAVGLFLCQGQGGRSGWIFRAVSCWDIPGSGKCEVMSPARAQQARKKDMLPQIAGKTKELRGGMKLQLPRKELAMPPRLVSTLGEEHEACGRCHT